MLLLIISERGGIAALIDSKSGRICTDAKYSGNYYDGKNLKRHPDTGIQFVGHQIPHWNECLAIAETAHRTKPDQMLLGWDFAWTKERGWDVVEANPVPAVSLYQMLAGKGIREDFVKAGIL